MSSSRVKTPPKRLRPGKARSAATAGLERLHATPVAARRAALAGALVLVGTAGLGGCGFQLRGTADLPFKTLYAGFPSGSQIGEQFRRELARRTTTKLVSRPQDAQVVLQITNERREKDIVAYSGVGRPRLFELRQRLSFRAYDGGEIEYIPPSEIVLRRDISAADNQLTARVDEEVLLFRDMQDDMVNQLLRRLASIRLGDAPT